MKKYIPLIFISYLLFSCTGKLKVETSIIRPAYSPYQLGMPMGEAFQLAAVNSIANKIATNRGYAYEENQTETGKKYYSRPILIAPPADTMLLGLKVGYSVNPDDLQDADKRDVMFVMPDNTPIWDTEIRDDVIKKVSMNYGEYDSRDTLIDPDSELFIRYTWKNKNDVDITLDYKATNRLFDNNFNYYYSVFLEYKYTDEMLQKINYRKSKY